MVFGIPSKNDLNQVIAEAPQHLIEGVVKAVTFLPEKAKDAAAIGVSMWDGLTPEQKKTVEDAIVKLVVTAAEAYVKKGS